VAPPDRRLAVDHQLRLLDHRIRVMQTADGDTETALVPDMQGIGSGSDVIV
jgi:hypothetical protein